MTRASTIHKAKKKAVQNCQTCRHPELAKIQSMLLQNVKYTEIVRKFHTEETPLTTKSLSNHNRKQHGGSVTQRDLEQMAKDGQVVLKSSLREINISFSELDDVFDKIFELDPEEDNFSEKRIQIELLQKAIKLRNDLVKTNQDLLDGEGMAELANKPKDLASDLRKLRISKEDDVELG